MKSSIHKCGVTGSQVLSMSLEVGMDTTFTSDFTALTRHELYRVRTPMISQPYYLWFILIYRTTPMAFTTVKSVKKFITIFHMFQFFLSVQLFDNIQSSQPQFGVALPLTYPCLPVNLVLLCQNESILLPSKHLQGLKNFSHLGSSHLYLLCV